MQARRSKEEKNEALLKSGKKERKPRHYMKKENEAVFKSGRDVEKNNFRDQEKRKWSLKKTSRGKS